MSSSSEGRGRFAMLSQNRRSARKAVSFQPARAAATFTLEQRIAPATFVWSGLGASANWTDGANWVGGAAPAAGSDLDFPASASQLTNNNDFTPGTAFGTIEIDQAGYSLSGNSISLNKVYFATYSSGTSTVGLVTSLNGANNMAESVGGTLTFSSIIVGTAPLTIVGPGTVEMTAANTYSGATKVTNGGTLEVSNSKAIQDSSTTIAVGSTLLANTSTVSAPGITVGGIGFTTQGAITTTVAPGSPPLTITVTAPITLAGDTMIDDAAGTILDLQAGVSETSPGSNVTFQGPGELLIDHGTYTGTTTVNAGTLIVGTSLVGPVVVNGALSSFSAAAFGATTGPVTVTNGGTLGVPDVAAVLRTTQLSLNDTSIDLFTIDSATPGTIPNAPTAGYSQVNAGGGPVTIAPNALLDLHFSPSYVPRPGDSIDLITNASGIFGNFALVPEGDVITPAPGETFVLTYKGGASGHDMVLNYVPATVAVSSSTNPSAFGVPVTLTATLNGATGTPPSGTVTFFDGDIDLGSATITDAPETTTGVASIVVDTLTPGAHAISVRYGGDAHYVMETSPAVAQVITKATTTTTLFATANPAPLGQSVTFAAMVTPMAGGSPTGAVSFFDGGVFLGVATVTGGVATFTTSDLAIGSHSITATYSGDPNFIISTSAGLSETITQVFSAVGIEAFQGPTAFGDTVTFGAYVGLANGNNSLATGTLTFFDGNSVIGTVPYQGQLTTFSTSSLAPGDHQISVSYSGNGQVLASHSIAIDQQITAAPTTTGLFSSAPQATFGQLVTYTASVFSQQLTVTPFVIGVGFPLSVGISGGTVQFFDGSTLLGSAALVDGQASITVIATAPGTHLISATYSGTPSSLPSNAPPITEQVVQANIAVVDYAQVFPRGVGFPITIFPVAPGFGVPTGTLTFFANGKQIGHQTLVNGMAGVFVVPRSKVLNKFITVSYSGDANFKAGRSTQIRITQALLNESTGSFQRFVVHPTKVVAHPKVVAHAKVVAHVNVVHLTRKK
jgi:autotransporter-associated beta strand protein